MVNGYGVVVVVVRYARRLSSIIFVSLFMSRSPKILPAIIGTYFAKDSSRQLFFPPFIKPSRHLSHLPA